MRELTFEETTSVTGAFSTWDSFFTDVLAGAAIGAAAGVFGGPGGVAAGALTGALHAGIANAVLD